MQEVNHVRDLEEIFKVLKHYGIKLKLRKYTFGVKFRKFLGYVIDLTATKGSLDKVKLCWILSL